MQYYLLFDSGCKFCKQVAMQIESKIGGQIKVRSLREPEIQSMLNKIKPRWQWEPMLLEVDQTEAVAYSRIQMQIRLVRQLGIRQAWEVAKIVQKSTSLQTYHTPSRRNFFKTAGGLLSGIALWGINSPVAKTSSTDRHQVFLPIVTGGTDTVDISNIPEYRFQQVYSNEREEEIMQITSQGGVFASVQNRILNSSSDLQNDLSINTFEIYGSDNNWIGTAMVQNIYSESLKSGVICGISVGDQTYACAALGSLDTEGQNFVSNLWKPDDTLYSNLVQSSSINEDMIIQTNKVTPLSEILPNEVQAASNWFTCETFCAFMCGWGWTVMCSFVCPVIAIPTAGIGAIMCTFVCYSGGFISCMGCRPYCNHLCNQHPDLC